MNNQKTHEWQTGHHTVWHSPDGVDRIEECTTCGTRILYNPCIGYPITLDPLPVDKWNAKEWFARLDEEAI